MTTQSAKTLYNGRSNYNNVNSNKFGTPTTTRPHFSSGVSSSLKRPNLAVKTPCVSRLGASSAQRLVSSATTNRGVAMSARHYVKTPFCATPSTARNPIDTQRISRTVDCARTSVRRSILTLNSIKSIDMEFGTSSSVKTTFRRSTFRK